MAGFCDVEQRLCLGLALWNGRDPILKERIFGLTGNQGNHGEDAKEHWWFLDSTPTHSWMTWRYWYPQRAYPYEQLITELLPADRVKALEERTANGGAEVVALLKTGSAFYAPAASTFEMVDAILRDRKRVLPCAVLLQGEFQTHDLFVGVPVVLGRAGMEKVFEIGLTAEEQSAFDASAAAVKELVDKLG